MALGDVFRIHGAIELLVLSLPSALAIVAAFCVAAWAASIYVRSRRKGLDAAKPRNAFFATLGGIALAPVAAVLILRAFHWIWRMTLDQPYPVFTWISTPVGELRLDEVAASFSASVPPLLGAVVGARRLLSGAGPAPASPP